MKANEDMHPILIVSMDFWKFSALLISRTMSSKNSFLMQSSLSLSLSQMLLDFFSWSFAFLLSFHMSSSVLAFLFFLNALQDKTVPLFQVKLFTSSSSLKLIYFQLCHFDMTLFPFPLFFLKNNLQFGNLSLFLVYCQIRILGNNLRSRYLPSLQLTKRRVF